MHVGERMAVDCIRLVGQVCEAKLQSIPLQLMHHRWEYWRMVRRVDQNEIWVVNQLAHERLELCHRRKSLRLRIAEYPRVPLPHPIRRPRFLGTNHPVGCLGRGILIGKVRPLYSGFWQFKRHQLSPTESLFPTNESQISWLVANALSR